MQTIENLIEDKSIHGSNLMMIRNFFFDHQTATSEENMDIKDWKEYLSSTIYKDTGLCFLDIETTGLSVSHNKVCMIGCLFMDATGISFVQMFDETGKEEKDLLDTWQQQMHRHQKQYQKYIWIHYNGQQFDIPFLKERCKKYDILFPDQNVTQCDLFVLFKKYQHLLHMDHMRQKDIEQLLQVNRKDNIDGGIFVKEYLEYLKQNDEQILHRLYLHNHDDVWNLFEISSLLSIYQLDQQQYSLQKVKRKEDCIDILLQLPVSIPISIVAGKQKHIMTIRDHIISLTVPIYDNKLKVFLSPCKDYYYLPADDYAIHKSVAQYLPKTDRIRATKDTCYEYIPCTDDLLYNNSKILQYVHSVIHYLSDKA